MDIVTDLTAEAVSYIVLLQDILKCSAEKQFAKDFSNEENWKNATASGFDEVQLTPSQESRINDLIWFSQGTFTLDKTRSKYFKLVSQLMVWMANCKCIEVESESMVLYRSPFFWRKQIRDILFQKPGERATLAAELEYMPLQVILAITGKQKTAYEIRLLQVYKPATDNLFNTQDQKLNLDWWTEHGTTAEEYLLCDEKLLDTLKEKEFPLPFETLFADELNEIAKVRQAREQDTAMSYIPRGQKGDTDTKTAASLLGNGSYDPLKRATDMQLMGLAFSGGGIRSATFNLGIIQRLASLNLLPKFDYISTVSGGGYIGTWLSSWIKRAASINKVADRLCPGKSGDPLADEVRPIRWLRMFSNYLSPNVGIMSPDAWASGMTWLRNTLINQFLLLLILLSVLSLIKDLYSAWCHAAVDFNVNFSCWRSLFWGLVILAPGSVMASVAMRSFDPPEFKASSSRYKAYWENLKAQRPILKEWVTYIPHMVVAWGAIGALVISIWFYYNIDAPLDMGSKIATLWPCGFSVLACFLFLAFRGNYHKRRDLKKLGRATVIAKDKSQADVAMDLKIERYTSVAIIGSSIIASAACVFFLAVAWILIQLIKKNACNYWGMDPQTLVVVTGVPIILEVLSLTVIVRMAIMGNLFPDYRREWWGRMGGLVNRFVVMWLLISSASLIIPGLIAHLTTMLWAYWGGWAGVVGWGVKKAFESKEKTSKDNSGFTDILMKVVPYIFMIGFLLIGSSVIDHLRTFPPTIFHFLSRDWADFAGTIILALITWFLSWRVGVNEFSLHHFYRNRLIRAYLGATRTREDRIKTANEFTGFDTNDDLLLSSFLNKDGYQGPFPIVNATLNATVVSALDRQDRMAESFVFTPLYCGYDFSPTRSSTYDIDHIYEYGYRPTDQFSNENGGPTIGTTMAISGAAVNPNWGYHSSASVAFLLTLFNVRLGWWIGNPRRNKWKNADPTSGIVYLLQDLIGKSDINTEYVCLSDGGHFDNMGLYELIRRRCTYIILGDGEQDDNASCEGLANAIRRCRIDFGVEIEIDLTPITVKDKDAKHLVKGDIIYPGTPQIKGTIIYIKTTLTGDEPVDIREYALANRTFPQQSTADQFFDEAQFESYRKLGYHSIDNVAELCLPGSELKKEPSLK